MVSPCWDLDACTSPIIAGEFGLVNRVAVFPCTPLRYNGTGLVTLAVAGGSGGPVGESPREDVRRRLERLRRLRRSRNTGATGVARQPAPPAAEAAETRTITTRFGPVFVREVAFPLHYPHGRYALERLRSVSLAPLADLADPPLTARADVSQIAFLDTETTGLSDGAGTMAFLVGVGWVHADQVRVHQYFLRDLHEEPALLAAVAADLEAHRVAAVVTYNGRHFDLPLLAARYTLNAQPFPLADVPHLDLLVYARRIWRPRLRRVPLSQVEVHVLGHRRTGLDVPGWLVPTLYRQYLQTGDMGFLRSVFYHNVEDILSLMGLTAVLLECWVDPWASDALTPEDRVAHARVLLSAGRLEEAVAVLQHAVHHVRAPEMRHRALVLLSRLLKRLERWPQALALWERWAADPPVPDLTPFEELAKYYEWRLRDWTTALAWVEEGLSRLADLPPAARARWEGTLQRRRQRLLRRLRGGEP